MVVPNFAGRGWLVNLLYIGRLYELRQRMPSTILDSRFALFPIKWACSTAFPHSNYVYFNKPKLAGVIRLWTAPGMQNFVAIS